MKRKKKIFFLASTPKKNQIPFIYVSSERALPNSLELQKESAALIIKANYSGNRPQAKLVSNYFMPPHLHSLQGISIDGSVITLDDGSQWSVHPGQIYEVMQNWRPDNIVTVSPSSFPSWVGARFFLTNQNGSYVYVVPRVGPHVAEPTTNHVLYPDAYGCTVTLENVSGYRTCWQIDPADYKYLLSWSRGQAVIVGSNNGAGASLFSSYPIVLINVELDEYVRARQY